VTETNGQALTQRTTIHATFVIERTYAVAPARVWSAWADPEQKRQWFGPQELAGGHELDFRVGGSERLTVRMPDGPAYTFASRFNDLVEPRRIVHTYDMYKDDLRMSVSVATIELEGVEGGTKLTFTEQGAFLDGLDTPAAREHGTRELLDALERALGGAPAGARDGGSA
jgi:uncharacterized protein YndB with AHSA1/START domain